MSKDEARNFYRNNLDNGFAILAEGSFQPDRLRPSQQGHTRPSRRMARNGIELENPFGLWALLHRKGKRREVFFVFLGSEPRQTYQSLLREGAIPSAIVLQDQGAYTFGGNSELYRVEGENRPQLLYVAENTEPWPGYEQVSECGDPEGTGPYRRALFHFRNPPAPETPNPSQSEDMSRARNNLLFLAAASNGYLQGVERLLQEGVDPHAHDYQALRFAARNGRLGVVKHLLEVSTYPRKHVDGALHEAAANGHLDVVKLLLEFGANPFFCSNRPLRFAASNTHLPVVELLLRKVTDRRERKCVVKRLLSTTAEANFKDRLLIEAADKNYPAIVRLLLDARGNPNAQESESLIRAVDKGHLVVAKLLLEKRAHPDAQNGKALACATDENHVPMVKLLLEHKANPNKCSGVALCNAVKKRSVEMVKLLLKAHADPNTPNDRSALHIATEKGYVEIVWLLKQAIANTLRG